jgi:hypothetical protein
VARGSWGVSHGCTTNASTHSARNILSAPEGVRHRQDRAGYGRAGSRERTHVLWSSTRRGSRQVTLFHAYVVAVLTFLLLTDNTREQCLVTQAK